MASQYSHLQFFRNTPNVLLGRYFTEKHGVLQEIPFDKLKERDVEPIFLAFTALPGEKQAQIEAEFQDIDAMACQGGVTALTDEANYHDDAAFPAAISKLDGFHGAVMWSFLDHPGYWTGATMFLHSDNVADSLWKKRNDLPHVKPRVDKADTDRLAQAISGYFFPKEGRGRNCKVEVYRRHQKEYFFAYPEDFAQSGNEWVRNLLSRQSRHSVQAEPQAMADPARCASEPRPPLRTSALTNPCEALAMYLPCTCAGRTSAARTD